MTKFLRHWLQTYSRARNTKGNHSLKYFNLGYQIVRP